MASSARIEELKKKFDENPRRYFAPLANEHRKAGDLEAAIAICRTHLPQQPGHMSGHIVFGQALFESGQLAEAQPIFQTALELDPENLIALRHLGDIARALGDAATARSWYTRVLEADPRNEEISALLSTLDTEIGARPSTTAELVPPAPGQPADVLGLGDLDEPQEHQPALPEPPRDDLAIPETTDSWQVPGQPATPPATGPQGTVVMSAMKVPPAPPPPAPTGPSAGVSPESILTPEPDTRGVAPLAGFEATEFQVPSTAQVPDALPGLEGMSDWATSQAPPPEAQRKSAEVHRVMEPVPAAPEPDPLQAPSFAFQRADAAPLQDPPAMAPAPASARGAADLAEQAPAGGVKIVTETMAELLVSQGHRTQAIDVYRQLVAHRPGDPVLRARLEELERMGGPTMRQMLSAIATWRPGTPGMDPMGVTPEAVGSDAASQAAAAEPEPWTVPEQPAPEPEPYAAPEAHASWSEPEPQPYAEAQAETEAHQYEAQPYEAAAEAAPADTGPAHDAAPSADPLAGLPVMEEEQFTPPPPRRSSGPFVVDESYVPPERSASADAEPSADAASPSPSPAEGGEELAASGNGAAPRGGSIDRLFAGAQPAEGDVRAAHALAAAFGSVTSGPPAGAEEAIRGEPARRASSELSLDQIFRAGGSGGAKSSGGRTGFSFDQFFGSGGGAGGAAPAAEERDAGATDSDDIQQFNSWLQGLKKR